MFETSKHVPKTEKRCCVFKDKHLMFSKYLDFFFAPIYIKKSLTFFNANAAGSCTELIFTLIPKRNTS